MAGKTLVVSFSKGGATEAYARIVAQVLKSQSIRSRDGDGVECTMRRCVAFAHFRRCSQLS
jgi:hypothetical protein